MKKVAVILLACMLCFVWCGMAAADGEPLHITFWHNRGSGAQYDVLKASVDGFNNTIGKEKGIFVDEVFNGSYADLHNKLGLGSQSGDVPVIMVAGITRVRLMMEDNLLADMMPYAKATGFDTGNLADCFMEIWGNTDGQLYSLPYIRSCPVLYYNKTLADELNLTAPTTIEEFENFCRAMYLKDEATGETLRWGFEVLSGYGYYHASFLMQLGEPMLAADGTSPAMEGTAMLKVFQDWRRWIDEGWCRPYDSVDAASILNQLFYEGKVGAFIQSSGGLSAYQEAAANYGFELGVTYFPTYDVNNNAVYIGGGNIALVGCTNTEEQKAAGWEFLQYLMSDERVAAEAIGSGYLPVTKSVGSYPAMLEFWEKNPDAKVAYDEMVNYGVCQEMPSVSTRTEFNANCEEAQSLLIQEQSITAEEAVEMIRKNSAHLFEGLK